MMRSVRSDARLIDAARRLSASAETLTQLRQSLAVLIPALTGASIDVTAEILGLSASRVALLRRQFRANGGGSNDASERRGGRRRALMSVERETEFLRPWIEGAGNGGELEVPLLQAAYEQAIGHPVPKSTVYRLLTRHGWRKGVFEAGET